jgi:rod shape-determining protein MreC
MRFIYSKLFVRAFILFALLAGFFIFDKLGYLNHAKSAFVRVYSPISNRTSFVVDKTSEFVKALAIIKQLSSENARLNQRINELSFENARLKQSKQENLTLRKALKLNDSSSLKLLPAEVRYLDPTGFSRTIVIDKGSLNGVAINRPVVAPPGILVGKVSRVFPNHSEVTLIIDPSMVVNAEVADSGARGLIKGEHGLGLIFDLVTQNEVIKSGDMLVTSGLGIDMPPGLLIGEIAGIKSSSSELFQKAFVSPATELKNLRFLFVVQ